MKLHHHVAVSTTLSMFLFMIFKSSYLSVACFLSGILIDLDHFIDYFREQGINLDIKKFFRICEHAQFNKILLLLHGWEWIIVMCTISWSLGWAPLMTGIIIGFSHHIMLDSLYNRTHLRTYSIIWRWSKGFDFDTVFPGLTPLKYKIK
ncbi:MAG: hypothetical protein JSW20_09175 [Nitrospiraceae bacterium]|nr:MAG: hypothetical protein JSW20_09175 [Nitrospiraceae bacterium]